MSALVLVLVCCYMGDIINVIQLKIKISYDIFFKLF